MLDETDVRILDELSLNSRISMKELGEKVHLTAPAASARVAKMEDKGIIEGYTIRLNQLKMGFSVHAMIHIYLRSANHQPYLSFVKENSEHILHNYKISGESCYLLECKFQNNEVLDDFLTKLSELVSYKLSIVIN
ncbi:transcriptional regulator [Bacillus sp. AFS015802]|uniref:Lrp/AsnC family transcriptional regulator n=1 Tax=Bacillus sp. AFS015802 TaxID=2033486 RepID=UPI000BF6E5C0|nr:Lrp/AsnC family transcriptional regulator [Bacillus sp. AFS015802]PFA69734.1 transcriptional regulator [Bacillus sp. AFS015802]